MKFAEPKLLGPRIFSDERGLFCEVSKQSILQGIPTSEYFPQLNHSFSKRNVLRGLHYQPRQEKVVYVISGKIWDVVVDIRIEAPSYGRHFSFLLNHQSGSLWIPSGFAHGFVALEDTHIIYQISQEYDPKEEQGITWNDPELQIPWPVSDPILSSRDQKLPRFKDLK